MTRMLRTCVRSGVVCLLTVPLACSEGGESEPSAARGAGGSSSAGAGSAGSGETGGSFAGNPSGGTSSGGATSGGTSSGGTSSGGASSGGASSGGASSGGTSSGGTSSGGATSGGTSSGGTSSGGASSGGTSSGGTSSGGTSSGGTSSGGASSGGTSSGGTSSGGTSSGEWSNSFSDPFDLFNKQIWSCEFTCPEVSGGAAHFNLLPGIAPNNEGSWSKIRYKPRRFTAGKFTVKFALNNRPERAVWWGIALWDDGPNPDGSEFNEINFGYTANQSFTNTQLLFESAKRGKDVSIKIDTGVNLYDGAEHTGQLEYDATHVSFFFDGKLMHTVTDASVIPTDPMDFIIGPRLVDGSALATGFTEIADSTTIEW